MKLIDKHLLREYLVPLFYCLCAFCMLYLVLSLFENIGRLLEAKKSFGEILMFFACYMAAYTDSLNMSFVVIIMPVSLLCGTLYSLYRLTRQNELTALRASGVSLYRLLCPFLGVALACSVLAVAVQELVAPAASRRLDEMKADMRAGGRRSRVFEHFKYFNHAERRYWEADRLDLEGRAQLSGVQITIERADMSRELVISAKRAVWADDGWQLYGVTERRYTPDDRPDGAAVGPMPGPVPMPGFKETPSDFLAEADPEILEKYSPTWVFLKYLHSAVHMQKEDRNSRTVDAHVRLAMPWACLVVALMGIPAGMRGGRQGAVSAVFLAVATFLGFYIAMQVGLFLGKKMVLIPWMSAWLANFVFFVIGLAGVLRIR